MNFSSSSCIPTLTLALSLCTLDPQRARACSGNACLDPFGFPAGGTVRANAGGVFVFAPSGAYGLPPGAERTFRLEQLAPGAAEWTELPSTVVHLDGNAGSQHALRTDAPLIEGASLRVLTTDFCESFGLDASVAPLAEFGRFIVGPAVEPPTQLGLLSVGPGGRTLIDVAVVSGSCSETVDAMVYEVELALDPAASAFAEELRYTTWIDGVRYAPSRSLTWPAGSNFGSTYGRGRDSILVACDATQVGIAPGTHDLQMTADLPDGTQVATPVVRVELVCDGPSDLDAGTEVDAGITIRGAGGASCAVGESRRRSDAGAGLFAALLALGLRRRRRPVG